MYEELGATATVWLHRALSCPAGVAFSAAEPPCTGEETVVPVEPEQVQSLRPDSKPALRALLTSAADAGPVLTPVRTRAAVTAADHKPAQRSAYGVHWGLRWGVRGDEDGGHRWRTKVVRPIAKSRGWYGPTLGPPLGPSLGSTPRVPGGVAVRAGFRAARQMTGSRST
ncbi:hypothetical protein SFUMM280S_03858 [Streptomyces fumanus]